MGTNRGFADNYQKIVLDLRQLIHCLYFVLLFKTHTHSQTGFYNDMHYHYGYHIYAAAIVAYFNPAWGRDHFEQVLLLVWNIANPSKDNDIKFPQTRHKDWCQGSSWASCVALPPYLNGKNQESSSEAIVALFGNIMVGILILFLCLVHGCVYLFLAHSMIFFPLKTPAWDEIGSTEKAEVAVEVRKTNCIFDVDKPRF